MKISEEQIKNRLDEFQKTARKVGIKVTPQRLSIFKIVAASEAHPDAEEIYQELQVSMPMVSLDTVYRTLWMLSDLGFLSTVYQGRNSVRFDANPVQHHHFYCIQCSMIRDFTNEEMNRLSIPGEVDQFGKAISLQVEIKGICRECQNKQENQPKIKKRS